MKPDQTSALLKQVKASLDEVLLSDRAHLNRLMRRIRQRRHDRQPADQLVNKLAEIFEQSRRRSAKRAALELKLVYPGELPVTQRREAIRQQIEQHQVVIVCGTTGSGKTTQLPKIAREAGAGTTGRIGITQPRRLAATGMARRVAEETGTDLGQAVGCQVRFDDRTGDETVIKFMTDGILLAETQRDRHLLQYDCLIIDEAHERSLNIDFILGYLKNLLPVRPDLRIIISSATLDAEGFSRFFDDAPVIEVEGRTYPVEDLFLPPGKDEELSNHILRAVRGITDLDDRGDILVFLPGEREIRDATKKLEGRRWPNTEVLPLFGRLAMGEQQRIFRTDGKNRRIILATNVAETSITIPGIHYVVDSGQVRLSRYNPRTQVQGLQVEQVSQASARQRRGRCGRITDGICFYLYDRETLENSPPFTDPEIRRTSLAGVILQMDLLGLPPIDRFPLLDPPQPALVNEGYRTLHDIGAIDEQRKLTPIGRDIARFNVDPHLARMLLQARKEGALAETLILVAFLSIQDVRERPTEKADEADQAHGQWMDPCSDFITVLNLWNAVEAERGSGGSHGRLRRWCRKHFINYRRVMEWRNLWTDLRHTAREMKWKVPDAGTITDSHADLVHRSLLAGLPANIGLKGEEREFTAARNRKFFIFPGSGLFKKPPEWVMTFALVQTTKLYARLVAEIKPEWVQDVAPHLCTSVYTDPAWNADKGFVYAKESVLSGGLTLTKGRRVHFGPINQEEARRIFIREGVVPANLSTRGGWLKLHRRMLDDIARMEEKIRRPGELLDSDAVFEHFDQLLPADVYSVKTLEQWLKKSRARIAMRMQDAMYPQLHSIRPEDYPDELIFHEEPFHLIYTFEPGDELDGIALVCPQDKMAFLPDWAPDWLVPGWLEEKVNRLLRTLPRHLRSSMPPIDRVAAGFTESVNTPAGPLLTALSRYLQDQFGLPVDASDFDEKALPGFLRMKIIEMRDDEIVCIHTALNDDRQRDARLGSAQQLFAKWELPPADGWPGGTLPEFITADDRGQTRGYPALSAENGGVARRVYLSPIRARQAHQAGLARLFREAHSDMVRYLEKRPPFPPEVQLSLAAIDSDCMADFITLATAEALTHSGRRDVRGPEAFEQAAAEARGTLYETAQSLSDELKVLLQQRDAIAQKLSDLQAEFDSLHDLELQLGFLFRPGFLQTADLFARYPRYLKGMDMRISRIRNNPQADLRKLAEIEPFQNRLNDRLLESPQIADEHELIEFAMQLEEFRINRFAPEIRTPGKISAQRLDQLWQDLQTG